MMVTLHYFTGGFTRGSYQGFQPIKSVESSRNPTTWLDSAGFKRRLDTHIITTVLPTLLLPLNYVQWISKHYSLRQKRLDSERFQTFRISLRAALERLRSPGTLGSALGLHMSPLLPILILSVYRLLKHRLYEIINLLVHATIESVSKQLLN